MSAQCWCFKCGGIVVVRQTWVNHGRKNKPDAPLLPQVLPVLSMPEPGDILTPDSGSGCSSDEDFDWDPFGLLGAHSDDASRLTSPEIVWDSVG